MNPPPTTILKKMDTNPNPVLKGQTHTCIHYQKDGSAYAYTSIQCKIDGDIHACTHQCQTEGEHICMPLSKRPTGMIYKMRKKHLERHAKKKNRQNLNLFEDIGCLEMAIMIEEKGKEFPQRFIFYYY